MVFVLAAVLLQPLVSSPEPTAAELTMAHRWAAAKFEGRLDSPGLATGMEVLANHGPVQARGRGELALNLAGQTFTEGFYCHAPSRIAVHLPGPAKAFTALVGVDSNDQTSGGRGSVVFAVEKDGALLWQSEVLREGMAPAPVSVDLQGAASFVLCVTDGGDGNACDQADWADARVTLADGTELILDQLPMLDGRHPLTPDPFFGFTYADRPSQEFLASWPVERTSERLDDARTQHTITWTDPDTGLAVRCAGVVYADFPTVEWTLYFKNTGEADTPILSDIHAIDARFNRDAVVGEFLLHQIRGDDCTERSYEPFETPLGAGAEVRVANTGGRPTQEAFPYFNIAWPGEGLIFVVSWAGQWAATFARDDANGLQLTAGQELTHFLLHPGEEIRTPMVVLQFYQGDWLRAQNTWRRWMFAHNVPRPGGAPLKPMLSLCTGNYYPNLMTEATQELAFLERHVEEDIDFDCWWQDAGWYPCDGVGWPKTGTWEVDAGRFPKGLREISDYVHSQGKSTVLWFEPERVHAGTWLTEEHPEWVHGGAQGGLLKLGDPACRAWLTDHIDRFMKEQGIDYYRQDFNIDPLGFWRANDAAESATEDRQGITEIRHVEGYFAYWDELIRRDPGRLIDSCASGGRRNDLETLRRAVPLLRSDWYWSPKGQQCLTYGLSLWIPYHGTGVIYEKDAYWTRSSMAAEMSFGPDAAGIEHFDFDRWRDLTQEWRRLSPYFLGDYYPLTPYSLGEDCWMVWQFDRSDLGEGCIQAFRRKDSIYQSAQLRLRGLDPEKIYCVERIDQAAAPVSYTGRELLEKGLPVAIDAPAACGVFVYMAE